MGWILFWILVAIIFRWFFGSAGGGVDDLLDNSLESHFLLETIVDDPSDSKDKPEQGGQLREQLEEWLGDGVVG